VCTNFYQSSPALHFAKAKDLCSGEMIRAGLFAHRGSVVRRATFGVVIRSLVLQG